QRAPSPFATKRLGIHHRSAPSPIWTSAHSSAEAPSRERSRRYRRDGISTVHRFCSAPACTHALTTRPTTGVDAQRAPRAAPSSRSSPTPLQRNRRKLGFRSPRRLATRRRSSACRGIEPSRARKAPRSARKRTTVTRSAAPGPRPLAYQLCAVAEQIAREDARVRDEQRRADRTADEQHGDV